MKGLSYMQSSRVLLVTCVEILASLYCIGLEGGTPTYGRGFSNALKTPSRWRPLIPASGFSLKPLIRRSFCPKHLGCAGRAAALDLVKEFPEKIDLIYLLVLQKREDSPFFWLDFVAVRTPWEETGYGSMMKKSLNPLWSQAYEESLMERNCSATGFSLYCHVFFSFFSLLHCRSGHRSPMQQEYLDFECLR